MAISKGFLWGSIIDIIISRFYDVPFFFLFFIFFVLITLFSFFFISYLGLYGIFISNFIGIFLFWCVYTLYFFIIMCDNCYYYINLGSWIVFNSSATVDFDFYFDYISYAFSYLTLTIGFFVYIFAFSYFRYEPLVDRLLLLLNSFMCSMIILVVSGNLIVLFFGWELIGLTSFFLINFWTNRINTFKSAFKAFSFNKISDFFLLLAIILFYNIFYTFDIYVINTYLQVYLQNNLSLLGFNFQYLNILSLCLLLCAFIKSAQFGFHIWLPDSMEAPVPASALIHSATLVSAGIFLILRFYSLFEILSYSKYIMIFIGSFTAFYGGWVSSFQTDIKRLLAYSTISHCGFLVVLCGLFNLNWVLSYLYIHGFFKALTFMCAGNIIRFSKNIQDYRRMGGYWKYLPFECFTCFICLVNLAGLPFSFGFFIKHLVFISINTFSWVFLLSLVFVLFAAFSGVLYSYRFYYFIFFDLKKARKTIYFEKQRIKLISNFYTNSSPASILSITFLLAIAFFFSYFLIYYSVFDIDFFTFKTTYLYNSNIFSTCLHTFDLSIILSIYNWVVLFFFICIVFIQWRYVFNSHMVLDSVSFIFIFSLVFFLLN